MTVKPLPTLGATLALLAAFSPLAASAAAAQSSPPPASASDREAYDRGYQAGRDAANRQGSGDYAPPPGDYDTAPDGYDGSQPPPPPPGYQPDPRYDNPDQDRLYQASAEDWAARNCVQSRGNAGGGAVVGGLLGALIGSSVAGRGDHGTGAVVGGIAGAFGGAAVGASQANATSPGCPPGYVVRSGAPAYYYDGPDYVYAAPTWYRPWVYYDNRWSYRPYPYHAYYYRTWGYGRPGYYGRPGGYYGRPNRGHGRRR